MSRGAFKIPFVMEDTDLRDPRLERVCCEQELRNQFKLMHVVHAV